jgi:hypothetical protein
MTLEYLTEQKEKYQNKANYFKNLEFDIISADFQEMVDLISKMEEYIKEKDNGED